MVHLLVSFWGFLSPCKLAGPSSPASLFYRPMVCADWSLPHTIRRPGMAKFFTFPSFDSRRMIRKYVLTIARKWLVGIGRIATWPLLELRIEGRENLPTRPARLILIANHFSWFDPPVLALALPFAPAFLV